MSYISKSVSTLEETRTGLCDEFVSVTGSDGAVAQCYLAENDWEMERALNSFFEADMEAVFTVVDSPKKDTSPPKVKRQKLDKPQGKIDWYTPDVVFLQELIEPYVQYLKKRAVSYTIIEGGEEGYFTGLMLKKSRVKLLNSDIISYPTTQMMRNLLVAQVTFRDQELCVMTSHFESCKGQAEERMKQLSVVLKRMREAPTNVTVLFGGDTNLRDAEVTMVGGLPGGVCDVWEQLGKQDHCRYTWDTKANSNKSLPYVSRCRFDRVYLRPAKEGPGSRMTPDHMALVGLEKLDCGRYTSDHWGIYCSFIL
ncbi:tyrosyl-DNA phosphodiesterase 2 isoform X2 [Oncorhynchus nerka]|uniref:tyrosyl-DNA phosphodiesterase 2 isoform X2 n=1 Tax=Oncorhynchus nerka TaxID=8023 RepID=UPI0031B83459